MGSLRKIFKASRLAADNITPKNNTPETTEEKTIFKTSGNSQGEDIGSSSESSVITRGSILNYRDKQKRQGLFGNIGTILGN